MGHGIVFDERIAHRLTGLNERSTTLGPGRLSRCQRVSIRCVFEGGAGVGQAVVRASHHQDFPATADTIATINAVGSSQSEFVEIPAKYLGGFVDILITVAPDGLGFSAWASGSR